MSAIEIANSQTFNVIICDTSFSGRYSKSMYMLYDALLNFFSQIHYYFASNTKELIRALEEKEFTQVVCKKEKNFELVETQSSSIHFDGLIINNGPEAAIHPKVLEIKKQFPSLQIALSTATDMGSCTHELQEKEIFYIPKPFNLKNPVDFSRFFNQFTKVKDQ